ncbi:MAG: transglycosylase SLT domain-containing protein [Pseudomonadota bacterium]
MYRESGLQLGYLLLCAVIAMIIPRSLIASDTILPTKNIDVPPLFKVADSQTEDAHLNNPDALPNISAGTAVISPWDTSLWTRLIDGFSIPDLNGKIVEKQERVYANQPDYLRKLIERGRPYLYYVANEVERRGMPMEIALLPMIESAFNPNASSRAHALGLWQIIPSTGRNLGLSQSREHDERRDVMAATRSALDYLEYLHHLFPDWQLALAAYNWGEGALGRSVSRNQTRGLPVDYWSVAMPSETRSYFPKLQALKNIIRNPETYGIEIPAIPDRPYFRSVAIDKKIGVENAARLADISVNEFSSLNPAFKNPYINGASNKYRLLIPVEKAETFEERIKGQAVTKIAKSKENLSKVSSGKNVLSNGDTKQGETTSQFVLLPDSNQVPVNGLKGEVRLGAGETLSVPQDIVQPELNASSAEEDEDDQTIKWVQHRVKSRETLTLIAKHYGVDIEDIQRWNHMEDTAIHKGKVLRLRVLVQEAVSQSSSKLRHHVKGKAIIKRSRHSRKR